jgi:hypothetical protein
MEWCSADIHPLDIPVRRDDGSIAHPRLVALASLVTNRLYAGPFLLAKGDGIRQEHVIETCLGMLSDPLWGVPGSLCIDNGSEFAWADLIGPLSRLVDLRDARDLMPAQGVRRALPYRPQSKVIETYSD